MVTLWPLAGEIARAIVSACAIEGDDPILVAQGGFAPRSRVYAFIALAAEFREIDRHDLARLVGWNRTSPLASIARAAATGNCGLRWFDLDRLNAVRLALGWKDLTLEEAASAPLQPPKNRREAFERGRKRIRGKVEIPSRELVVASEYALGGRLVDVTASVCGDPEPTRSALSERLTVPASEGRSKNDLRDESFVAGWFAREGLA